MTQQEAKEKSQNKMKAIEAFCQQMQIVLTAKQVITKEGLIENIVFYTDNEKYDIQEAKTEEVTYLRTENAKDKFRIRPSVIRGSEGKENRTDKRTDN